MAVGGVTDFFDLGWFPVFNVADIALDVGVALLVVVAAVRRGAPTAPDAPMIAGDAGTDARRRPPMNDRFTHNVRADEAGMRLDVLLGQLDVLPSRSAAQRLLAGGYVLVNGEIAHQAPHHAGGRADRGLRCAVPRRCTLEAEDIPLDIRFEDAHLIVLSKPAGLVVHPARGHCDRHARARAARPHGRAWHAGGR